MSSPQRDTVTRLLVDLSAGKPDAASELFPLVYDELRALAASLFQHERRDHTLQPTALVHEAYLRLVDQSGIEWDSRKQFFFLAAKAMRNILVDHARGRNRLKRGGGWRQVSLVAADETPIPAGDVDLIALDDALTRLAALDERKSRLIELRFFGGLTSEQAADLLDISRTTAAEDWRMARAWLSRELKAEPS